METRVDARGEGVLPVQSFHNLRFYIFIYHHQGTPPTTEKEKMQVPVLLFVQHVGHVPKFPQKGLPKSPQKVE